MRVNSWIAHLCIFIREKRVDRSGARSLSAQGSVAVSAQGTIILYCNRAPALHTRTLADVQYCSFVPY